METERIIPRIEGLTIKNYRALKHLQLKNITPLTVFLGPNGSGKSTLFDVFAFLSECFSIGLRKAWDKRGRFKELRTRNSSGPIFIELKYREKEKTPIITYRLVIEENSNTPSIVEESLRWRRAGTGSPFKFLEFHSGVGSVISGEMPDEEEERIPENLTSADVLAVSTLGQLQKHPRVSSLRKFITSWYLSYISADYTRVTTESGTQEHLSKTGDNMPNVIQFLQEEHGEVLNNIFKKLSERIPRLERVQTETMVDGRLLLLLKDKPFSSPILAKFASDGTLKMLAYLTVLLDPDPPQLIGVEEPENQIHHRLLTDLADECREASNRTQIFISTHSPFFVNSIKPEELWIFDRDKEGYTIAKCAAEMQGIQAMYETGGSLGYLWSENYFEFGDPIKSARSS